MSTIDLTGKMWVEQSVPTKVMAHPGGKMITNKEKAQAAFLARIARKGVGSLSSAQKAALKRVQGGGDLFKTNHSTYGLPSFSSL